MNGFRRLGLRWWRRNLLRTFRRWRETTCPLRPSARKPHALVKRACNGTYAWRKRKGGIGGGLGVYIEQVGALRGEERVARSLEVAADGLRRAAGPRSGDHPSYLTGWWEWTDGSTPFFWNCPARYREEVRDGQCHFLTGEFGSFVRPQPAARIKEEGELVRTKLVQVRRQDYIE